MHRTIICCIVQHVLFFSAGVESLKGSKVVAADNQEFPFVASLQNLRGQHFCSGTLVTSKHVITAAHCLEDQCQGEVEVAIGESDLSTLTEAYAIESWLTYNAWASKLRSRLATDFNDIAIITLIEDVGQADARPIRLTSLNKQQARGQTMRIFGWHGNPRPTIFANAYVQILSDDDCQRNRRLVTDRVEVVPRRLLCTAATGSYVLLQDGDSGGPLLDGSGALMGVNTGHGPRPDASWGNFSEEFLQIYQFNIHSSMAYTQYRHFISYITGHH